MIQLGCKTLTDQLSALFMDIMAPGAFVPDYWSEARLKVLFKGGNMDDASNYRPIALLCTDFVQGARKVCPELNPRWNG